MFPARVDTARAHDSGDGWLRSARGEGLAFDWDRCPISPLVRFPFFTCLESVMLLSANEGSGISLFFLFFSVCVSFFLCSVRVLVVGKGESAVCIQSLTAFMTYYYHAASHKDDAFCFLFCFVGYLYGFLGPVRNSSRFFCRIKHMPIPRDSCVRTNPNLHALAENSLSAVEPPDDPTATHD